MDEKPSSTLWPGWAFYLCPHRAESHWERRAGGKGNEQHWLLSAAAVAKPLAFIKELYPFTLIKRQCFYLQGSPPPIPLPKNLFSVCLGLTTDPLNLSVLWFLWSQKKSGMKPNSFLQQMFSNNREGDMEECIKASPQPSFQRFWLVVGSTASLFVMLDGHCWFGMLSCRISKGNGEVTPPPTCLPLL